ncbi:MAG: DNA primase [Streptosporangiales bacterium]|nr:DNA primase [Streptosporangiales bacterium]
MGALTTKDLRETMRERLVAADLEYAELTWPTVLAHRPLADGARCSCGRRQCPEPGAHPISPDWRDEATADPEAVAARRQRRPDAGILLATGLGVDVLDAPAMAGASVLDDLERKTGRPMAPVAVREDRYLFFVDSRRVEAGEAGGVAPSVSRGRMRVRRDPFTVLWHAAGSYVLLPPSLTPDGGRVFWLRRPAEEPRPDPLVLVDALVAASTRLGGAGEAGR